MKRFLIIILAAAMIAGAIACGKKAPEQTPDQKTPEPGKKDPTAYENVVEFETGVLKAGSFNWRYFLAKVDAGMNADVQLVDRTGGEEVRRKLSYDRTSYTLIEGENAKRYTRLVSENVPLPAGTARVAFLTNDPSADLAAIFGGSIPEEIKIGPVGEIAFIVYLNAAPSSDELAETVGG